MQLFRYRVGQQIIVRDFNPATRILNNLSLVQDHNNSVFCSYNCYPSCHIEQISEVFNKLIWNKRCYIWTNHKTHTCYVRELVGERIIVIIYWFLFLYLSRWRTWPFTISYIFLSLVFTIHPVPFQYSFAHSCQVCYSFFPSVRLACSMLYVCLIH